MNRLASVFEGVTRWKSPSVTQNDRTEVDEETVPARRVATEPDQREDCRVVSALDHHDIGCVQRRDHGSASERARRSRGQISGFYCKRLNRKKKLLVARSILMTPDTQKLMFCWVL